MERKTNDTYNTHEQQRENLLWRIWRQAEREGEREFSKMFWEMKNVEHTLMISGRRPGTTLAGMPEPVAEPAVDVVIIAADELCRDEKYS